MVEETGHFQVTLTIQKVCNDDCREDLYQHFKDSTLTFAEHNFRHDSIRIDS